MEPVAAAGLAFFLVLAATRDRPSTASFLTGCLLAGIAPLVRPEMLFLSALLVLPLLGQWRRLNADTVAKLTTLVAGLLLASLPLALWSIYSLHAFGHLLPNTNAAKRASPADSVVVHLLTIYALGLPVILGGVAVGAGFVALNPSAAGRSLWNACRSAIAKRPQATGTLPLAGWIFLAWPAIASVFYIVNHTYVQTRYILTTAPGLMVVLLALAFARSLRTGRIVYLLAVLTSVILSVAVVRPFLRNKALNCQVSRDLALFVRDHVPAQAPVADYSIGEIAFVSEHPIVDTGGITRPGAIPYLNGPPEQMVNWARREGAQYFISDRPTPDAVLVYRANQRFIGWTFHVDRYRRSVPIELWRVPGGADLQSPSHAAGSRPASEIRPKELE